MMLGLIIFYIFAPLTVILLLPPVLTLLHKKEFGLLDLYDSYIEYCDDYWTDKLD